MRNGLKFMGLAAVAALSLTALAIQGGVVLKHVSKVGDATKMRLKSDMDMNGTAINFSMLLTSKVSKVADDGTFTLEEAGTDIKVLVGGTEQPTGGQEGGTSTRVYKSNGQLVSSTSTQNDPNDFRVANLEAIVFPNAMIKIGDTWPIEIKKNDKGALDAKGTAKVELREMVGKHDTYKIHVTLKEATAEDPIGMDGFSWIDVSDGSLVKMEGSWTNFPVPMLGPTNMKFSLTREE